MSLKLSSKVSWGILSIHIAHTPTLDEPFRVTALFQFFNPFFKFQLSLQDSHILPKLKVYCFLLSKPISSLIIGVSPVDQVLFQIAYKKHMFQDHYSKHILSSFFQDHFLVQS